VSPLPAPAQLTYPAFFQNLKPSFEHINPVRESIDPLPIHSLDVESEVLDYATDVGAKGLENLSHMPLQLRSWSVDRSIDMGAGLGVRHTGLLAVPILGDVAGR
jgi:hypothetical protein